MNASQIGSILNLGSKHCVEEDTTETHIPVIFEKLEKKLYEL